MTTKEESLINEIIAIVTTPDIEGEYVIYEKAKALDEVLATLDKYLRNKINDKPTKVLE